MVEGWQGRHCREEVHHTGYDIEPHVLGFDTVLGTEKKMNMVKIKLKVKYFYSKKALYHYHSWGPQ